MVTADRAGLVRRSLLCFERQTYPNKEIVIVDDGKADLSDLLARLPAEQVRYRRIEKQPDNVLGNLRNLALDAATGDIMTQWDDDDWYHPERIERQVAVLKSGADVCWLSGSLAHLNDGPYRDHPFTAIQTKGVPGSIMHWRDDSVRYNALRRGEDSEFLRHWLLRRWVKLPADDAYLFVRCFHGTNTWNREHFLYWMRNSRANKLHYFWCSYVLRDLWRHRVFRLTGPQTAACEMFLADSRALGLL